MSVAGVCVVEFGTKCFTKSTKKLSMNKSDRLIVYEICVTLASSTEQRYSLIYFSVDF